MFDGLALGLIGGGSKESAANGVDEIDLAVGIEKEDPFAEGFEDLLQQSLLPDELREQALEFAGLDLVEAVEEFVENGGFQSGRLSLSLKKGRREAMSEVCLILTTFPDLDQARQIGTRLVEKQLVACVNIHSPCESIYRWKGEVCRENEIPAIMKSSARVLEELEAEFHQLHPYEVPKFLVIRPDGGSEAYLDWVEKLGS